MEEIRSPGLARYEAPTVAIIIACYNYGAFLSEAIDSALAQTRRADAIIVIDDGSTDCTPDVLAHYADSPALEIIRQSNRGAIATFNRGIRAGSSTFFVLLDADDRLDVRFLERTIPVLAAHSEAGFAYTGYRVFGARHRVRPALDFDRALLARRPYFTASALIRRAAFDAVGGYSAEMARGYEDWDLYLSMAERGWEGVAVPEALFHYRQHRVASRNSMSFREWLALLALLHRRHRALHPEPLVVCLARAIVDQNRLTARAAPRAALRRIGSRPANGAPVLLLLGTRPDRQPHPAADVVTVAQAAPGGVTPPGSQGDRRQTVRRTASATWTALGMIPPALRSSASFYHAAGEAALPAAALGALRRRAVLVYEPTPGGPMHRLGPLVRLALCRVDVLIAPDAGTARHIRRRIGLQPTIIRGPRVTVEDIAIERGRELQLYRDLRALVAQRGDTPGPGAT